MPDGGPPKELEIAEPELKSLQSKGREALDRLFQDQYEPFQKPEDGDPLVQEIDSRLERLDQEKQSEPKKKKWNEAKEKMVESLEVAKVTVRFEQGQVEAGGYYFRGDSDGQKTKVEKTSERDEKRRLKTFYKAGERKFSDENKAKRFARESDLIRRAGDLAEVEKKLQAKEKLAPKDWGRLDAAHVIATLHVHDVNLAVESGVSSGVHRAIRELERAKDDLSGLDASKTEAEIERLQPELPTADQLEVLAKHSDVAAGIEGKKTTYLGQKAAEVTVRLVEDITKEPPRLNDLKTGRINLEEAARGRVEQILTRRAERMYQDPSLKNETFEKAAEIMGNRTPSKEETRYWQLLQRAREHHEAVALVFGNPDLIFSDPDKETLSTVAKRLLSEDEMYELLDYPPIRRAMVYYFPRMRQGEIFWGEKGQLFNADGQGRVRPAGGLPIHERLALEILYGMGVHPDPFYHGKQTEAAWGGYKLNDALRRLFPYDKDGEASEQRLFYDQFVQAGLAPNGNVTLIVEHPRRHGVFLIGTQLQMRGVGPEEIRDKWEEVKRNRKLRGAEWYVIQLRKAAKTCDGFLELFKKKVLTPKDVFSELGDKFAYLSQKDLDIKQAFLRPFYDKADESEVRRLKILAATMAKIDKTALYQAVMENGVGMTKFYEMIGLYFTPITGEGSVSSQVEAMAKEYRNSYPGASDAEVQKYILERTGLDIEGVIPEMYQDWRSTVGNNLVNLERFKGNMDQLLALIKEKGIDGYRFKKGALSRRLAELLLNDPIYQALGELLVAAQERGWQTFLDEFAMLEKRIKEGDLLTERDRADLKARIVKTYVEEGLDEDQYLKLLDKWEGLSRAETNVGERLETVGGQFNEAGWSLPILAAWFLGEVPLLPFPKWDPRTNSFHRGLLKWGGFNPIAVESTGLALIAWATANLATTGSFSLAGLSSIGGFWGVMGFAHGMTILSRLVNEGKAKSPRLTRASFENYQFPNDHTLGVPRFAWWFGKKVVTFIPERVIRLVRQQ